MIIKLKEWRSRHPQRWAGGTKVRLCPVLRTVREGWLQGLGGRDGELELLLITRLTLRRLNDLLNVIKIIYQTPS